MLEANYSSILRIVNILQGMKDHITKLAGWFVWVLIVLLGLNLVSNISRAHQIEDQIASERAKLEKIEAENAKLASELAQAQSPDFIEKQVRDKLGLGKEGEATVVLPDPDTLRKLSPTIPSETDTLPDPTWKKWLKLFI